MECPMNELVRENARSAREMRGVAILSVPQTTDPGWRLRRNTLLRSEYPQSAPPPLTKTKIETESGKSEKTENKLILLPSKGLDSVGVGEMMPTPAQKRVRTEDSIISVDPKVLKNKMDAVSINLVGNKYKENYTPPPLWKMSKVLVGHRGWVWTTAVDPSNSWFATGGGDAVIKVWDLTTGALKINLTGHKECVRSISLSTISPYMFSGSDDHSIKCWDLERNEIIRDFHGHKGAVHCVRAHPSLDVVLSGGRDKTVRVWDVRTRACVHLLVGHSDSVMSLATQQADPQVISGGSDGMIYLWDIAAGRAFTRLTRHKKPVRGLAINGQGNLASCGADKIRVWSLPHGEFLFNTSITNSNNNNNNNNSSDNVGSNEDIDSYRWSCCAFSPRNVLAVGSQEGKLALYDWGNPKRPPYQMTKTKSIPGTLPGEGGINCLTFDASGSRMITAESDKSVKVWRTKE